MTDWQPNDLALCVTKRRIDCGDGFYHDGTDAPKVGSVREVSHIHPAVMYNGLHCPNGCHALCFTDGSEGLVQRFRKLDAHAPDAEDVETIELMNRIPTLANQAERTRLLDGG